MEESSMLFSPSPEEPVKKRELKFFSSRINKRQKDAREVMELTEKMFIVFLHSRCQTE